MSFKKFVGKLWENASVITISVLTSLTTFFVSNRFSDPIFNALVAGAIAGIGASYIESKYDWVGQ